MDDLLYRRHLPHWVPDGKVVHLVFRLAGSSPQPKPDILLKNARPPQPISGPTWLNDQRVADVVEETLLYGNNIRAWYRLFAHVIIPNHVHILLEPLVGLPQITQWLKGRTARVCNCILGRTGAFWHQESYDHWIRRYEELEETARYIENNPVRAGLVKYPDQWKWSSASMNGCYAAGQTKKNDGLPYGRGGQEGYGG